MLINLHYYGNKVIEEAPFEINRKEGSYRYIFFHFLSPVTIYINDTEKEIIPGSCILYTPGTKQLFKVNKHRLNHDYIDFTIDNPKFFNEINFTLNNVINPYLSNEIQETIDKIAKEKKRNTDDSKYLISSYLMELFIRISRKINVNPHNNTNNIDSIKLKFEEIRLSLYQNPSENMVNLMAEKLEYSLPYFNLLYKKFFDITPMADLNNARIEFVKEQFNEKIPIEQIMNELGFTNSEYFYRWFKKTFGKTPKQYLKENNYEN